MNFELNRLSNYFDDEIIKEIQRVDLIVNKSVLTKKDFSSHSRVHYNTIIRKFGDWKTALSKAGISNKYSGRSVTEKQRIQLGKKISDDEILNELKKIAHQLGRDELAIEDINSNSNIISPYILRSRFGSFKAAIVEASLKITQHGKRYSDIECFENLLKTWTYFGRQPTHEEMKKSPSMVGPKAYVKRFGSWKKAIETFIQTVNSGNSLELQIPKLERAAKIISSNGANMIVSKEDRREIPLGLRFKIFKRDSFKCKICGRSPAKNFEIELHIDHLIPFTKGGKTI